MTGATGSFNNSVASFISLTASTGTVTTLTATNATVTGNFVVNVNGTTGASLKLYGDYTPGAALSNSQLGDALFLQTSSVAGAGLRFGFGSAGTNASSLNLLPTYVVTTNHSTLDDGSGNASLGGNLSVSPGSASNAKLSLYGSIANPTGFYYGFGANSSQLQYNSQGGHAWFNQSTAASAQTNIMTLSSSGQLSVGSASVTGPLLISNGELTTNGSTYVIIPNRTATYTMALTSSLFWNWSWSGSTFTTNNITLNNSDYSQSSNTVTFANSGYYTFAGSASNSNLSNNNWGITISGSGFTSYPSSWQDSAAATVLTYNSYILVLTTPCTATFAIGSSSAVNGSFTILRIS